MMKGRAIALPKEAKICHYCKVRVATTRDHIVPKARGGQNIGWNYVPACQPCNNKKADKWPECLCETCGISVGLHELAGVTEDSGYVRDGIERQSRNENVTGALSQIVVAEI